MNQIITEAVFEDMLYGDKDYVRRDITEGKDQITYLYVYEGVLPVYVLVRHINSTNTNYWKESI